MATLPDASPRVHSNLFKEAPEDYATNKARRDWFDATTREPFSGEPDGPAGPSAWDWPSSADVDEFRFVADSAPFDYEPSAEESAWWDAHPCLGDDEPEVDGLVVTLPDWLDTQASYFRSVDTGAARWLADEIQQLADLGRTLHAVTVDQFDGRRDVEDRNCAERLAARGGAL